MNLVIAKQSYLTGALLKSVIESHYGDSENTHGDTFLKVIIHKEPFASILWKENTTVEDFKKLEICNLYTGSDYLKHRAVAIDDTNIFLHELIIIQLKKFGASKIEDLQKITDEQLELCTNGFDGIKTTYIKTLKLLRSLVS